MRRGSTSGLSPLTPTGSAPSAVLIRISGETCTERTFVKTATLHGEGTPPRLYAAMLFAGNLLWLAQDGGVCGVEGEAMLFVVGYRGRCGLGDGEEMSLL